MVRMVVGDENIAEPPAFFDKRRVNRRRITRVDGRRRAGCGIMQQHTEIVARKAKLMNDEGHRVPFG